MTPKPKPHPTHGDEAKAGINMASLCQTLARVLVQLEETEYSGKMQQDTVVVHDALSNPESDCRTQEADR